MADELLEEFALAIENIVLKINDILLEVDKAIFAPIKTNAKTETSSPSTSRPSSSTSTSTSATSTSNSTTSGPSNLTLKTPTGQWAYWAPDVWAGKPQSQWRKLPVNCGFIPGGGQGLANDNKYLVYHNGFGYYFAYPSLMQPTLNEIQQLAYVGGCSWWKSITGGSCASMP